MSRERVTSLQIMMREGESVLLRLSCAACERDMAWWPLGGDGAYTMMTVDTCHRDRCLINLLDHVRVTVVGAIRAGVYTADDLRAIINDVAEQAPP